MTALWIRGGRVIDPANHFDQQADVRLEDGRIHRVVEPGTDHEPAEQTLDATGLIVCPGLIDIHVHLREPGQEDKETIVTGANAAVAGGFTTICCMPNTSPALDDDARIEFVYRQAENAACHVYPVGAISKQRQGEELAEIGLMAQAGAVAFSDDGDAVASAAVMARALTYIKMTGRCLMQHCEEPTLVRGGAMNASKLAHRLGLPGRPAVAETLIIQRDLQLNAAIGCAYHVQHLSTAASVDMIAQAQQEGQPVTAEVAPHHLLLTEQACADYDTHAKVNPPLRTQRDIDALRQAVADGVITILATDHAPHTLEEKQREFAAAPSGMIGLDCALALYAEALIHSGMIDWPQMLAAMTHAPAALVGLDAHKGQLRPGYDGDVTLIDPDEQWTIDVSTFASRSRNCPWDARKVKSRPVGTIVNGHLAMLRDSSRLQ